MFVSRSLNGNGNGNGNGRGHRNGRSNGRHTSASVILRKSGGRSYSGHRDWLLQQHGPVCAYCGLKTRPERITLDHVRPRRGQTAYDRPDNLVLACPQCNALKADSPFMAFLLARRSRGVYLLHYGEHLSEPIKEMARQASERPILLSD
jgi:hypothetical protein